MSERDTYALTQTDAETALVQKQRDRDTDTSTYSVREGGRDTDRRTDKQAQSKTQRE